MAVDVTLEFEPQKLRAFSKNEVQMKIVLKNSGDQIYWSECDISVTPPLSLSHDSELGAARTRVGILRESGTTQKQIRLYTRPNNYPDEYKVVVTAFVYDGDGAIAERIEKRIEIPCVAEESTKTVKTE